MQGFSGGWPRVALWKWNNGNTFHLTLTSNSHSLHSLLWGGVVGGGSGFGPTNFNINMYPVRFGAFYLSLFYTSRIFRYIRFKKKIEF